MKYILLLFIILSFSVSAQQPGFNSGFAIGSDEHDYGNRVIHDANGDYFLLSTFWSILDLDPGSQSFTVASNGAYDISVAKYDNAGNLVFGFSVGGGSSDFANSAALDGNGNILITGMIVGQVDFDPSPVIFNLNGNNFFPTAFIAKYSNTGALIWAGLIESSNGSQAYGISVDDSENIIVGGNFHGSIDFDLSATAYTLSSVSPTGNDAFLAKYNSFGTLLWAKTIGGSGECAPFDLLTDSDKSIYMCGHFQDSATINPLAPEYILSANGNFDCFVTKFDSTGSFQWARVFGAQNNDYLLAMVLDVNENICLLGSFSGNVNLLPSLNSSSLSLSGTGSYLTKLDKNGTFHWSNMINHPVNTAGFHDVSSDLNNNIYITGYFTGIIDMDPSTNTFTLDAGNNYELFVSKYNSSGSFLWSHKTLSNQSTVSNSVDVDNNDNIHLTGNLAGSTDFDFSTSTNYINGNFGQNDIFYARYSQMPCAAPSSPTSVAASTTFCANSTETLIVTGAGSIIWYNTPSGGSPFAYGDTLVVSSLAAGTYSYYAEANTCAASVSRELISFTVFPSPSLFVFATDSICAGESVTLTASGADSYLWNGSLTGNHVIVSPFVTTNYSVTGTNIAGCTATASINVIVEDCSAINENSLIDALKIFPNPAYNTVYFDLLCDAELEICNALSKQILFLSLSKGSHSINALTPGIYLFRFTTSTAIINKKIIVK